MGEGGGEQRERERERERERKRERERENVVNNIEIASQKHENKRQTSWQSLHTTDGNNN